MSALKPVLLTPGEPSGIGPEIILRAWSTGCKNIVLIGNSGHLSSVAQAIGVPITFAPFDNTSADSQTACRIIEMDWPVWPTPGKPDVRNAPAIIAAIERAVAMVKDGQFCAVTTPPIAKSVLYEHGFDFPGHTEFLAALDGPGRFPVMMLANRFLRTVPLTIHVPLCDVESFISADLFARTIQILESGLHRYFGCSSPQIAIAGLNPHAGENGHIGRFEVDVLAELLNKTSTKKAVLSGPYSADSLFHPGRWNEYDAVLCMYHDQALIPVKTIDFHNTVNITLGLDYIRTSPDHGTAFDRAAAYNSTADSLISAINTAHSMAQYAHNG